MSKISYLTTLDVEGLHAFIMQKTGQEPASLRDRALLESAIMRPQMVAFYGEADLVEQCALMAVGISQAGAFVDGNKRTAFVAADVFLRVNGSLFTGDPMEMARHLEAVADPGSNEEGLTNRFVGWLRRNVALQPKGTD